MSSFLKEKLDVSDIVIAIKVPANHINVVHKKRPSHGLAIHTDGDKEYDFGNRKLRVRKNDIIYMPKGSDYSVKVLEEGTCYAVNFTLYDDFPGEPFVFSPKNPSDILDSFKTAEKLWRSKSEGYILACKSELYHIFHTIISESATHYQPSTKLSIIKPALDVISEKYTSELLSVSHLSALCGVSEVYFRKIFKNCFGVSPVKYINDLKINRAGELLSSGMYSVRQAGEMAGFSDISHFSRVFKKISGVSPSDF